MEKSFSIIAYQHALEKDFQLADIKNKVLIDLVPPPILLQYNKLYIHWLLANTFVVRFFMHYRAIVFAFFVISCL